MYPFEAVAKEIFGGREALMEKALTHELESVELVIARFEVKYRLPFAEFRERFEAEAFAKPYAYELERDFLEWEASEGRRGKLLQALQRLG